MKCAGVLAGAVTVLAVFSGGASAAAPVPESKSAPTISGVPIVGKTLKAGNGLWYHSPTSFSYRWLRCNEKGASCSNVAGATQQTYRLTSADVGHTIVVLVTARNAAGSSQPTNSKPTDVVTQAVAPTIKEAPSIVGKPFVGESLVADTGEFGGGAVERFRFQWRRCDGGGGSCADISGATGQSYGVLKADVGSTLRVEITATNEFGSTQALSKPTAVIKEAPAPVVTVRTTLTASKLETICCQRVTLSGTITPARAGSPITIVARAVDQVAANPIATTTTDASGNWSVRVTPLIETTYVAQTSTSKGSPITVRVHPRVGFGINGNVFSAKITARDTFAGAVAFFQVLTNGRWKTIELVVTNLSSTARFEVKLKRGRTYTVRIYLPQRQAGRGYLDGVSHVRRVGGKG